MSTSEEKLLEQRRARYIEALKRRQVLSLFEPLEQKLRAYREGKLSADELFKFLGFVHVQSEKIVKRFRNRPEVILAEIAMDENRYTTEISGMSVKARLSDITALFVDAIVNPADPKGVMSRGLAAAIKAAGGEEIEKEAISKAPISITKAVPSAAGSLPSRYVIHVAVSEESGGKSSSSNVRIAAASALALAEQLGVQTIAFPAMGSGTGGLSLEESAEALIAAIEGHKASSLRDVTLVGKDEETVDTFLSVLEKWDKEHE